MEQVFTSIMQKIIQSKLRIFMHQSTIASSEMKKKKLQLGKKKQMSEEPLIYL